MRRRRLTVGFEVLEEPEMRVFRHAFIGMSADAIVAEHRAYPRGVPLGTFWCAACFKEQDHAAHYRTRRIYDGTEVPEDARCADCSIRIRELQEQMRQLTQRT